MSSKHARSTGLVDAVTGRPVLRYTETGNYYVRKGGWAHFWGRTLDALVVMAVAGILMAVFNSLVQNGTLGYTFMFSTGAFYGVIAAIWFGVLFGYGMICGAFGGLGDAAAGMRGVRVSDGTTSGAWLGGWRAVCWSFAPVYVILAIGAALSGSGGDSIDTKFAAIDLRSGLARGQQPIPDPKAVAETEAARAADAERRNLPNLYGRRPDAGS
ncbi:hypothetical protein BIU82_15635 [Arthrobacter sp. SW1]|uniref:hypothetical protein n=1 Tax=Arthrobacter sp. SW1 TaxID=1920889 RepID=UPI000877D7BA|nr:hypothetical protein [Arthrobacter sp. SW1]OFI39075.1 hypothetical protein BIU82_15635 [Arthrobacter sp. SW1]